MTLRTNLTDQTPQKDIHAEQHNEVNSIVLDLGSTVDTHLTDSDAHDASAISFVPNGSISSTDVQAAIQEVRDETSGAPTNVNYLVGTTDIALDNEIVVGTTPGGELEGTWASPVISSVHSGSSHASVQAAAESTAAGALAAHEADNTNIHGITNTANLETISGAQNKVNVHEAKTTSVHGITNTALLETTSGSQSKVDAHKNTTTNIHGITNTANLETATGSQAKVDTHKNTSTGAHAASAISFTPNGSISSTDVQTAIQEVRDEAGGSGAPTGVNYLVGTADGTLTNEIVVGTAPGGELGGTWASPTVDSVHSGSSHASIQSAAESALSTHEADTINIHGITDTTNIAMLSGGTFTGAISLPGNAAANLEAVPKQQLDTAIAGVIVGDTYFDAGNSGTAKTITWADGSVQKLTLTGNATLTFVVGAGLRKLELHIFQDGTGNRVPVWPNSVLGEAGADPVLSTTAGAYDIVILRTLNGGSSVVALLAGKGIA